MNNNESEMQSIDDVLYSGTRTRYEENPNHTEKHSMFANPMISHVAENGENQTLTLADVILM